MTNVEICSHEVYTTEEAQKLLKISSSTIIRLIKKGIIRTAKIGKQYRIMGKELLRLLSPELEDKAGEAYSRGRVGRMKMVITRKAERVYKGVA